MNLDELSRAAKDMDEAAYVAAYPEPALIFKPVQGDAPPGAGPDMETDQYALPGQAGVAQKARESMGTAFVLFLKSPSGAPIISVGRGREADITIPLGNVSRIHAHFSAGAGGQWTVTDFKSTNGTFVNDSKLTSGGSTDVLDGAWIRFGADATVKFYTPLGLYSYLKIYRSSIGLG